MCKEFEIARKLILLIALDFSMLKSNSFMRFLFLTLLKDRKQIRFDEMKFDKLKMYLFSYVYIFYYH